VAFNPIITLVVDGAHFELHALEITERLLDQAKLIVGGDNFGGGNILLGQLGTENVTAVKESFASDLFLVRYPQKTANERKRSASIKSSRWRANAG
jgi:hypothetical protein